MVLAKEYQLAPTIEFQESPYHHNKEAKPAASSGAEEVLVPRKRDRAFCRSFHHPSSSAGPVLLLMTCSNPNSTLSWKKQRTKKLSTNPLFGGNNYPLAGSTFDGRPSGLLSGSDSCELLRDEIIQMPHSSSPGLLVLPLQNNEDDLIAAAATATAASTATAAASPQQQQQEASFLEEPKQESQDKGTANSCTIKHLSVSMDDTTFRSIDHQTSNASDCRKDGESSASLRFRSYQAENWTGKFEELLDFRLKRGHCLVPYMFGENSSLAEWVKRQRHQYKLKNEGKHSALSEDRIEALETIGFVWNSHDAIWEERWKELCIYKDINSNCNVPSKYLLNPQLAVWVKRQRRQYKFFSSGKLSTMSPCRIEKLEAIGFAWDGRKPENC